MGQAAAASAIGAEALWWNPALIARGPRELALNVVSGVPLPEADISLAFVYPIPARRIGRMALSLRYVNLRSAGRGEHDRRLADRGAFRVSTGILAATFAAPFADRLAFGVSLKIIAVNFSTTGQVLNAPH